MCVVVRTQVSDKREDRSGSALRQRVSPRESSLCRRRSDSRQRWKQHIQQRQSTETALHPRRTMNHVSPSVNRNCKLVVIVVVVYSLAGWKTMRLKREKKEKQINTKIKAVGYATSYSYSYSAFLVRPLQEAIGALQVKW